MDHDFPRSVRAHDAYTTAALTPKALASIGAANTRTDTTRPIMQARRPNSVSSPPHSMAPPAISIPMRPIAYATGPVRDVAIAVMGFSHGSVPEVAAFAVIANAYSIVRRRGIRMRPAHADESLFQETLGLFIQKLLVFVQT